MQVVLYFAQGGWNIWLFWLHISSNKQVFAEFLFFACFLWRRFTLMLWTLCKRFGDFLQVVSGSCSHISYGKRFLLFVCFFMVLLLLWGQHHLAANNLDFYFSLSHNASSRPLKSMYSCYFCALLSPYTLCSKDIPAHACKWVTAEVEKARWREWHPNKSAKTKTIQDQLVILNSDAWNWAFFHTDFLKLSNS